VINPAVAGTGLKIKTVEAIAHLRPVVGWPHNRDGLPDAFKQFVYEATNWRDFAQELALPSHRKTKDPRFVPGHVQEAFDERLRRRGNIGDIDPGDHVDHRAIDEIEHDAAA